MNCTMMHGSTNIRQ